MRMPLDEFVQTDGNREAFKRVADITQQHDKPVRLFLVGPKESGKTTLVRARQLEKDLLSTKRVLYRPCSELPEAMRAEVYDGFFEDLGTFEVLFLDDFEGFFEDADIGPMMCKLLLGERMKNNLDTVITSTKPLSEYDLSEFGGMLDSFEEITMEALDDEGMVEYVRGLAEDYHEEDKSPVLSPEAIEYLAHDLRQTPSMIRKATHFLITQYEGEPGQELSRSFVEQALA